MRLTPPPPNRVTLRVLQVGIRLLQEITVYETSPRELIDRLRGPLQEAFPARRPANRVEVPKVRLNAIYRRYSPGDCASLTLYNTNAEEVMPVLMNLLTKFEQQDAIHDSTGNE